MKTSVEISDALFARAKRTAAERGTTLRQLLEEGLERVLDEPEGRPEPLPDLTYGGSGFVEGVDPENWVGIRGLIYEGRGEP